MKVLLDFRPSREDRERIRWACHTLAETMGLDFGQDHLTVGYGDKSSFDGQGLKCDLVVVRRPGAWKGDDEWGSPFDGDIKKFIETPMSFEDGRPVVLVDVIYATYWLTDLCEEKGLDGLDEKRRSDLDRRKVHAGADVLLPIVDIMARKIVALLPPGMLEKARWPENKKHCVVLSHDVDILFESESIIASLIHLNKALRWRTLDLSFVHALKGAMLGHGERKRWVRDNFAKIQEIESGLGASSTWFFYAAPWSGYKFDLLYDVATQVNIRRLMRKLRESGHEIGLHSSIMSAMDSSRVASEKRYLEKAIGRRIAEVRQHELAGPPEERVKTFSGCGLSLDSSIGFNHSAGFRSGISVPYTPFASQGGEFLELPLSMLDNSLAASAADHGCSMEDMGRRLIEQSSDCAGMLVMDWHPHVWNNPKYPGWGGAYGKLAQYARDTDAWLAAPGQVHEWWLEKRRTFRPFDRLEVALI